MYRIMKSILYVLVATSGLNLVTATPVERSMLFDPCAHTKDLIECPEAVAAPETPDRWLYGPPGTPSI